MAKRVSLKLREFEHYVARLTNQRPAQPASSVEYRDGYIEEAASVAADLHKPVALVLSDNLRRDIHVRLVLGRDIRSDIALFSTPGTPDQRRAASTGQGPVSTLPAAEQQPTAALPEPVASAIREAGKRHQSLAVFRTPALLVASGPLQDRDALAILEPKRM